MGGEMAGIRVIIANDRALTREGLAELINAQEDMDVVGVAADGERALECCREASPDVAIVDLLMPKLQGLRTIKNIHACCPRTRVLALSAYDDAIDLRAVLAAGGAGYITMHAPAQELYSAVRELHAGRTFIRATIDRDADGKRAPRPSTPLSRREREVLALLVDGYTNKEIAERLDLQKKTVDTYRTRLQDKLGLRGRAALVRYALSLTKRDARHKN